MEIIEATAEEFKTIIPVPYHVFGSGDFALLNENKAEKVYYLLFKDRKYRLGLIGGVRQKALFSPFSAPFGGFVYLNKDIKISQIDMAVEALVGWSKNHELESIHLTLPPPLYQESFIAKHANALFRQGFTIEAIELNYYFRTEKITGDYAGNIWRNAKKNISIALDNKLGFHLCQNREEKQRAYEIIKINRNAKGVPLRMTWEQVEETASLIPAEFFLGTDEGGVTIASAIVFPVAENIVRIIFWGDVIAFSYLKTMNFLSYKVFEHYQRQGIKIIDLGRSTDNSTPNHGLCEFKESIGCNISQKLSFLKKLNQ